MANAMYEKGREAFGNGNISWPTDNIKAVLVDSALYTENLSTDEFLSDIPVGARTSTSPNLTGKTNVGGVLDAADTTFTAVTAGDPNEYVILYQDTAVEGSSRLIGRVDTATGLPVTPNGGDITVQWDNGANKILKL